MALPPSKSSITGTPTNAQAKVSFGQLWDYVVGLLGGDASATAASDAEKLVARSALGFGITPGRNRIINGNFAINQRAYVSGAATAAGQYTRDRWKVSGTGGVTFNTLLGTTIVTIPAGQTLQQVIEGLNLESGQYVLSWGGTAQGRVITSNGSTAFGASGTVIVSAPDASGVTIEFNAGTVTNVQFEAGAVVTPFERRDYGRELMMCQRYYYAEDFGATQYGRDVAAGRGSTIAVYFPVTMRATPTVTVNTTGGIGTQSTVATPRTLIVSTQVAVGDMAALRSYTASAEL